jgi:hypothetical protein
MDNIKSWSAFEEHHQRQRPTSTRDASDNESDTNRIDALYVSPSSTDIAQSAASLLRQAGLTGAGGSEEEFKLKFHWIRPHPSLVFEIEDELMHQQEKLNEKMIGSQEDHPHPAVETSRLMKAHRYAQLANDLSDEDNSQIGTNQHADKVAMLSLNKQKDKTKQTLNLPLEMPKLRINLASLVDPPLMSSWLPGEGEEEEERR